MSTPPNPADMDPSDSDALLSKADALIRRNRPDGVGSDVEELPLLTDPVDDLPELTDEVVLDLEDDGPGQTLPDLDTPRQPIALGISEDELEDAVTKAVEQARMSVAEQLIDLDARIGQALEEWMSAELPQLMAAELDSMVERLRERTLAHMHATLIPQLSADLAEVLDATMKRKS